MKAFIVFLLIFTLSISTNSQSNTVYLCNGPGSKKYHYIPHCRGLKSCSTQLEKVSLAEARRRGRSLCGYED